MSTSRAPTVFTPDDQALIESGLNLIQQGLSIFNAKMELVLWNKRFVDMFELPGDFVQHGMAFRDINLFLARRGEFGPGDPEELTRVRVDRAKSFEHHYFERIRPNGRMISVEGTPLSQGGWVTVYSDITETRRQEGILKAHRDLLSDKLLQHSGKLAETNRQLNAANRTLREMRDALQASEERMRTITRAMPAHIAYLDRSYTYRFTNNRFRDVMGLDRDAKMGQSLTEAFPPHVFTQIKPAIDKALGGKPSTVEYDMPGPDGTARSIRSTFTPEVDDKGHVPGVFVLSIDRTEEKAATELLVRSKRMETTAQLTSGLAHDFSNILTIVLGNLNRIGKPGTDETQRQELIRSTERAARRGTRIIDNLMAYLFRQRLNAKQTNVSAILRELVRLFRGSVDDTVNVTLHLPLADVTAQLDEGAFQDAVLNVLFNARDAIESAHGSGEIVVSMSVDEPANDWLRVCVCDNGLGFSQAVLSQAQEPFFTTKPQGKGSGLGLAMVRNFTDRSGGALTLGNREGGGAEVCISIPLLRSMSRPLQPPKSEDSAREAGTPAHRAPLMLVVDDDAEMRVLLRDFATGLGYPVIEANSAAEAEALVAQVADIGLMVSDIVMPGSKNGLDLALALRESYPRLATLLVSGLPPGHDILQKASTHFSVLRKPFTAQSLGEALSRLQIGEVDHVS